MGKISCDLTCPKCHKTWGKMAYEHEKAVCGKDIQVTAGKQKKFKDGEDLACTLCGHKYTTWDIILAVNEAGKK